MSVITAITAGRARPTSDDFLSGEVTASDIRSDHLAHYHQQHIGGWVSFPLCIMVVVDLEKQELAFKDEIENRPIRAKGRISRRAKIWIRLSISILLFIGIHNFLSRRKQKHDVVEEMEHMRPLSESGPSFSHIESVLDPIKAEELFL